MWQLRQYAFDLQVKMIDCKSRGRSSRETPPFGRLMKEAANSKRRNTRLSVTSRKRPHAWLPARALM